MLVVQCFTSSRLDSAHASQWHLNSKRTAGHQVFGAGQVDITGQCTAFDPLNACSHKRCAQCFPELWTVGVLQQLQASCLEEQKRRAQSAACAAR